MMEAFVWPVPDYLHHTNSPFGWRGAWHRGFDVNHACDRGDNCGVVCQVPIFAAASGTVVHTGYRSTNLGHYIIIRHANGMYTLYAHNHTISIIPTGEHVRQGQQIAVMGNTGNSQGPHLHFELRTSFSTTNPFNDNSRVNPLAVYNRDDTRVNLTNPNPLFICIAEACQANGRCIRGLFNHPGAAIGGTRGGHQFVFNPNFDTTFFTANNSQWWNP